MSSKTTWHPVAAAVVLTLVISVQHVHGAAAALTDYGSIPALSRPDGDALAAHNKLTYHTDQLTGRFNYSIPIELPPARQNSGPQLALEYNSANANGWCGVGWDLQVPYITRDISKGPPVIGVYSDAKGFVFSAAGRSGRLVNVGGVLFRPEVDTDCLNFSFSDGYWTLTNKSGTAYIFGNTSQSRISDSTLGTFKWCVTRVIDSTGNETTYAYDTEQGDGQIYIKSITYNTNGSIAGNCSVDFTLSETARNDKPSSVISGIAITTSKLLEDITVKSNDTLVRKYHLTYTTSESTGRSLLRSVTQVGNDNESVLPPITFGYQALNFRFNDAAQWSILASPTENDPWGVTPVTQDAQLIDINSDGLPDRVVRRTGTGPLDRFTVQLNTGSGFSSTSISWTGVDNEQGLPYDSQYNTVDSSAYAGYPGFYPGIATLLDMDGDRLPDRVMAEYPTDDPDPNNHFQVQLNTGSAFSSVQSWTGVASDPESAGWNQNYPSATSGDGQATLVLLADMNGDGLPDRVMMAQDSGKLDVQFNNIPSWHSFSSVIKHWSGVAAGGGGYAPRYRDINDVEADLIDMNGDGLPDRILNGTGGVFLNDGVGKFLSKQTWGMSASDHIGAVELNNQWGLGAFSSQLLDINGDGLPDLVSYASDGNYNVRRNTGSSFSSTTKTWSNVSTGGGTWGNNKLQAWDPYGSKVLFVDINGDGLVDRVMKSYDSSAYFWVQTNAGPFPDLLNSVDNGVGGSVAVTYVPSTQYDNSDGTRPRLPFPVYTVSSITVNDGIRTTATWNYTHAYGYYDTSFREFRGFALAQETDPMGVVTKTYFYLGGGRDMSASGEYQDSRYKAGMAYYVKTTGSDGEVYKEIRNQINQVRIHSSGVYFPYISNAFELDYESLSSPRTRLIKYGYYVSQDNLASSSGNLAGITNRGEVTLSDVETYAFQDVSDPPAPVYTSYAYASLSNPSIIDKPSTITRSSDAAGANVLEQSTYTYDGATGNLLSKNELICPETWSTTLYEYDDYGNQTKITDPASVVTTREYDSASATFCWRTITGTLTNLMLYEPASGLLSWETNQQGLVTSRTYDPFYRLTQRSISTSAYGGAGLWREKYEYHLQGIANDASQNYIVSSRNEPANATSGDQKRWTYLDGFGRPIQVCDQSETSGHYRLSDVFYNNTGTLIAQTYPAWTTSTPFHVPSGSPECTYAACDPVGRPYKFYPCATAAFDSHGKLTSATPGTGDSTSPTSSTTLAFFDGTDPWAINVTDPLGKIRKFYTDAFGRTNRIVEAGVNYTTSLAYDQLGNLTNITDHLQNSTAFFYDCRGSKVAMADPDIGFWQYRLDPAGRLVQQIDANGQTTKLFYDASGRVYRKEGWNPQGQQVSTVTYQYDSNQGQAQYTVYYGQLFSITDDEGWQKFSYDVRNRLMRSDRYLAKNGRTYTTTYTYDDADRVATMTYPGTSGPTVQSTFDVAGHLISLQRTDAGGTGFTYCQTSGFDELHQLTGISFPNGVSSSFGFYANSKRLNTLSTTVGANFIQNLTHEYNSSGDFTKITDSVSSHSGTASSSITATAYDDVHRLTSITWYSTLTHTYSYDAIGNITRDGETGAGTYTYSTANPNVTVRPHLVKSANGTSYTYDLNGNMVIRGGQHLTYDVYNRLIKVVGQTGSTTTMGYSGGGERLWEQGSGPLQVWIGDYYEEKGGKTLYHILAGGRRVCTFEPAAAGSSYDPATQEFYYYHPDHLGSSSIMTDRNGTMVQHYEYTAYGQDRYSSSTTAFPISRKFTGQILDSDTGLYYYNFRYYDPQLGKFIQPDDIIPDLSNPQSYNRYSYVLNNPLRYTDPDGHWGQEVADWWSGTVSRGAGYITASPSHWIWNGTVGTVNSLVGGLAAPLTLGSSAGSVSGNPNAKAKDYAIATVTEAANVAAIVPVTAAGGKAVSTLVRAGEKEIAGELASQTAKTATKEALDAAYPRVKLSKGTRAEIWERSKTANGKVYDPSGVEIKPGEPWQAGHRPGEKFTDAQQRASQQKMDTETWKAYQRDPDIYRPEKPRTNLGHQHESDH